MNTLTILLVAAVAVVASGMKGDHPKEQVVHRAFHEGGSVIGEHDEHIFEAEIALCL